MNRITFFSIFCTFGVLVGIIFRTHDVLGIPIQDEVRSWKEAGYSEAEARQITLYHRLSLLEENKANVYNSGDVNTDDSSRANQRTEDTTHKPLVDLTKIESALLKLANTPKQFREGRISPTLKGTSVLFADSIRVSYCRDLNKDRWGSTENLLQAYKNRGGGYSRIADLSRRYIPTDSQSVLLDAIYEIICKERGQ